MLSIKGLSARVEGIEVLRDVNLDLPMGELHVLFGPNGCGKSSLLATIMGLPPFERTAGDIHFLGESIISLSTDERAKRGIGMAFQHPPPLDGVRVIDFAEALGADGRLEQAAQLLRLAAFDERDVGEGFSGGELKRWEVLKLALQQPRLMLFDEPESGVDLEHIAVIGRAVARLMDTPSGDGSPRSGLVITHSGNILEHVKATRGHLMVDGKILGSGDPVELFRYIKSKGYTVP